MNLRSASLALAVVLLPMSTMLAQQPAARDPLLAGFRSPPDSAKLRCYWWWLNGHTTSETITRDLTEMQHKGYGGVLLVDANGSNQTGNSNVPAGPTFGSPAWTALYLHALKVADQLGLEVTLNITSGWNLGAPWVKPENASKLLTFSRTTVPAGATTATQLPAPPMKLGFYRQIAVLAYPLHQGPALPSKDGARKPLPQLNLKASAAEAGFSMPNLSGLLTDPTPNLSDADANLDEVLDISSKVDPDGTLHWTPPSTSPQWEVLRVGYTPSDAHVSTSSGAWQGLAIDYLDPAALDLYWNTSVLPLIHAAKPYHSLKYIASDSWELGGTNWTPAFRAEFRQRRGYDPVPYLPIVAGRILGSRNIPGRDLSTRFLADLRRTVADLVNDHYDHLAALGKPFGLGIQCESGGPHSAPLDALETFRSAAVVQTEYWAYSPEHRSTDEDRFFVKEAASAAHIYGKPLAAAEGMTSIGNQWNESLGLNLKPSFDRALTEGLNRLVWHEFTSSPPELGLPGQEYFAGTHLNPNVTWWRHAAAFTVYLNRAQFLLQQGQPVADVLYYYGDMVPNFVRLKKDDPAQVQPGYDYDVTDTEALLHRLHIVGNEIATPEGIRYKVLALPDYRILPLPALQLAATFLKAGGTVVGQRPLRPQGVISDADHTQFETLTSLWDACETNPGHHISIGLGQLFCTGDSRHALQAIGATADLEVDPKATQSLDYIHRSLQPPGPGSNPQGPSRDTDVYFIRNTQPVPLQTTVTLRATGQPIFLDAVTGETTSTLLYAPTRDHRTTLPITLEPYGSTFILFRRSPASHPATVPYTLTVTRLDLNQQTLYDATTNHLPPGLAFTREGLRTPAPGSYELTFSNGTRRQLVIEPTASIPVPQTWALSFPPNWGAPARVRLNALDSWSGSSDPGVRYFSGTATYQTTLNLTSAQLRAAPEWLLSLGEVHEVAAIRINGQPVATLWRQPWVTRVDPFLHPGRNTVEIDVTNLWPNRLIGDAQAPIASSPSVPAPAKPYTWTNITYYRKNSTLLPSGLLGPVTLQPSYRSSTRPETGPKAGPESGPRIRPGTNPKLAQ